MGGALSFFSSQLPAVTAQLLPASAQSLVIFFTFFCCSFEQQKLHLVLFASPQQSQSPKITQLTYCVNKDSSADQRDDPTPVISPCRPPLNSKKERSGWKLQPTFFYRLKAPGILQVGAKINKCGLKSLLLKPHVITATASLHITKT